MRMKGNLTPFLASLVTVMLLRNCQTLQFDRVSKTASLIIRLASSQFKLLCKIVFQKVIVEYYGG